MFFTGAFVKNFSAGKIRRAGRGGGFVKKFMESQTILKYNVISVNYTLLSHRRIA
jgi:hypothetical protein